MPVEREEDRMLSGRPYRAADPELATKRARAGDLTRRLGAGEDVDLAELLGSVGEGVAIVPPFFCDYGTNIHMGARVFVNSGCVILDCARVDIGDHVQIGPGVHIYAATHPLDPAERRAGWELAVGVTIGNDVWLGGRVVVCPGVRIGDGTTVGAGSVVANDLPPGVLAVGNPCRVVRPLVVAHPPDEP